MARLKALLLAFAALLAGCCSGGASRAANSDPPAASELLSYRNDSSNFIDAGGILPTDSLQVYLEIESYSTLRAVILDRRAEPEVLELAVERALLVAGPRKFFTDLRRDAVAHPELFRDGFRRTWLDRAALSHVWVGGSAFIDDSDQPRSEARKVLERVRAQVDVGTPFQTVLSQVQEEFSYESGKMHLTRVGNFGDFVLSSAKRDGQPFRSVRVPQAHVERLLTAKAGEMHLLIDETPEDAREPRLILYYVREVYRP